jgi:hypothetical protein
VQPEGSEMEGLREGSHRGRTTPTDQVFLFFCTSDKNHNVKNKEFFISNNNFYLKNYFFYNCQKNVTFMHRYQVAKYVIFDSEKIFVKKFPWMLK